MFETVLLSILILVGCFILLSIRILLKKDGNFVNIHIEGNKFLEEKGIHCVVEQDNIDRNTKRNHIKE